MALICHCEVVSERVIWRTIRQGAHTVDEVQARCGAGSRCGGCRPAIEELIESHHSGEAPWRPRLAS